MKTLWLKLAAASFAAAVVVSGCGSSTSSTSGTTMTSDTTSGVTTSGVDVNLAENEGRNNANLPVNNSEVITESERDVLGRTFLTTATGNTPPTPPFFANAEN
jgi:uncharacterized protein YceK